MKRSRIDSILQQIYRKPGPPSPAYQTELETRLTALYVENLPEREVQGLLRKRMARWYIGAALICGTAAAVSQVSVVYAVEVGKRLTISVAPGDVLPQPEVLMPMLEHAGSKAARVRTQQTAAGSVMVVELWGDKLPGDLSDEVRSVFPTARVSVTSLAGSLRGSLLDRIRYQLLGVSDPRKIEDARAALIKELAAKGEAATVEISTNEVAGRSQSRVLVRVPARRAE